ncbi:MAG: PIG-L deacetylase family protein [Syntrophomonas sp.]
MYKILVFAPHPDDDLIGCGGSMAKHLQQGNKVSIAYLSSGDAGSLKYTKRKLQQIREKEAGKAAALLGVTDLHFFRMPDGYIEYNHENIIKMVTFIREQKPNWVYLPHGQDAIKDHRATHELVMEACNRAGGPWFQECGREPWTVENILGYEVWTPLQNINHIEDISEFMQVKLDALRLHQSQIEFIRYDDAIEGLDRYRGVMSGKGNYCECFQIIKARISNERA